MCGSFGKEGRGFQCSGRSLRQPSALAGCVQKGISQQTSAEFSSIADQDYDYTPVQIR
ncbi:hypothetical protein LMG27174_05842 [Paraburkholderia rhynchosiae]|uniref:Uncharacterized protein n=1 Tax=Paraburkholderia rhynchosiae TaxID=487049 RepID=A0A6J5CAC2_9BURK|nr:hypothetical protein LMG27174_05842 [Paraburkholderia rhynchosiae]